MRCSDNREMVDACFERLLSELGPEAGRRAVRIMVEELGGLQVYVPSARTLEIESRDAGIRRQFNGSNYKELAIKYKLGVRRVRRIVNRDWRQR